MEVWIDNIHPKMKLELEGLREVALKAFPRTNEDGCRLNLILADDAYISDLNLRFTGRNRPTDVLSFPLPRERLPTEEGIWGEIYISLDRAVEQARDYGVCLEDEVKRLAIHGILHLLGYDHKTDGEAQIMRKKEDELLWGEPLC